LSSSHAESRCIKSRTGFRLCVPVSQEDLTSDWERDRYNIDRHLPSEPAQPLAWSRQALPYLSLKFYLSKARVIPNSKLRGIYSHAPVPPLMPLVHLGQWDALKSCYAMLSCTCKEMLICYVSSSLKETQVCI